jgi:hypothetical protein
MKTHYVYGGDSREPTVEQLQRIEENNLHEEAYKAFLQLQDAEMKLCDVLKKATLSEEPVKPNIPPGSWYTWIYGGWHRVRIKTPIDQTFEIGAGLTPQSAALEAWAWFGKPKCEKCGMIISDCECKGNEEV